MPTAYLIDTRAVYNVGVPPPVIFGQASQLDGGFSQGPNFQIPPFEYNGNTYCALTSVTTDLSFSVASQTLTVASSSDRQNFTVLDPLHAPSLDTAPRYASNCYIKDLPNHRLVAFGVASGTLFQVYFDLATNTWGTPLTGGPALPQDENTQPNIAATQISATKYLIVYNGPTETLSYVILDSGVWGAPQDIIGLSSPDGGLLMGACVTPGGNTWVIYQRETFAPSPRTSILCCNRISSTGTLLGETQIATMPAAHANNYSWVGSVPKYITAAATVFAPFTVFNNTSSTPSMPNQAMLLKITSPDGTPAFATEGVMDYFPDNEGRLDSTGVPYFYTSLDESTYHVATEIVTLHGTAGPADLGYEQIWDFERPASGSTWTGPTVLFTAQTDQPPLPIYLDGPPPVPPPAELNSVAATFYADGTQAITFGMLAFVCGVQFFANIGNPGGCPPEVSSPGLLPTYIAPNPPGSCIPWTPTTPRASAVFYDLPLEKQGS